MEYAFGVQAVRMAEQRLLDQGVPLMEQASFALATSTIRALKKRGFRLPGSTVLLLVGSGNNGADALFAGVTLARRGLQVAAVVGDRVHDDAVAAAHRAGLRIVQNPDDTTLRQLARACGTWIDGILGIGAVGQVRDPYAAWIRVLCEELTTSPAKPLVVAVDVPSGLNADSGESPQCVVPADMTVTMGCLKPALLEPPAAFLAGSVEVVPLGFEQVLFANRDFTNDDVPAGVRVVDDVDVRDHWFVPGFSDHKYTRGVLGVLTGSAQYPGAANLSVGGAHKLGLGMIRYLGENRAVVKSFPEVVNVPGRVQALLVGSGVTELGDARTVITQTPTQLPLILDAGGIDLVPEISKSLAPAAPGTQTAATPGDTTQAVATLAPATPAPATLAPTSRPIVITPHAGELARLLTQSGRKVTRSEVERKPRYFAQQAAETFGVCVVLKGSITLIADPVGGIFAQSGAPAWTGTAGAGDVLAGVIAGVVTMFQAQRELDLHDASETNSQPELTHSDLSLAAAIGVHLHSRAAATTARCSKTPEQHTQRLARRELQDKRRLGIPITASDIIDSLSDVIDEILNYGR
ncbi:hydroxyethylthiazole kinase-like uncharacterized protein yjeF [Arcanobacterium pluranimalium]|uniref:bifunctional ADP-dependent NAD(P)H-hydrate dehydratase/NAD(P)H-hydrate epimerase n=1 Tax=Arcanobacterium pluranimalium TaxID=108028 RepID=UPI00195EFF62|nr:NAD(P)H-hydrate epimerase [Arcanobacterium pluranimalium]MBM7824979.1 hydroxyethylthiazole kinase-like uncharacterized protein yjeF [Arcanobacterium pluranimalium]